MSLRITDGSHFSPTPQTSGKPIANVKDMRVGKIDIDSCTIISIKDFNLLKRNGCSPEKGDVLFSKDGTIGKTILYTQDEEIVTLSSIAIIKLKKEHSANFVSQALKFDHATRQIDILTSGSALRRLVLGDLKSLKLPAPPLSEQRRIADILDTIDRTIEDTRRIIAKLQAARRGLLHDLLTRGLDERGQLRDPEKNPELFQDTVLGRVPRAWEVKPANHVCLAILDCINRTPPETEHGYAVLKTPNIRDGRLVASTLTFTDAKSLGKWNRRGSPKRGDVVFTREAPAGEACVLPDMDEVCLGQRVMLYRPNPEVMVSEFMLLSIYSQHVQDTIDKWTGGSTVGHLRVGDVRKLPFLVPPLAEQNRISELVGQQNLREQKEQAQLAKLQTLKRGLMEDLLTGRVRVTVGESEAAKRLQAEPEPPANIPFEPHHIPTFDPAVHFRASAGADPAAQTDWVTQAREIAARQQVQAYSREALDRAVHDLAELSMTLDGILQVPDVLKAAGVRFVLLKHPKGSKTSGAAFWLDAEAKPPTQPVVALSMRYPHIDVFWFNLFHELGHIWHGHAAVMGKELVTYSDPAPAEKEAHAYAREALIPEAVWQPYLQSGNHTVGGIHAFARTVGRHHATVAGRLAHDLDAFNRFNSGEHRSAVPKDLFDRLLLRLGGSL
ncbi:restriction endonuclease subunit S [Deinococcus sp. Arct2-2]|uniref:restriction endonuclease subunit S n=1 Tax=Deinococcus sp. Arct2-2 TaxID=2568653 RepID=UPI001454DFC1|nr:restriction endonuclease subunit S [Deinococcus sp. Arct2-2]